VVELAFQVFIGDRAMVLKLTKILKGYRIVDLSEKADSGKALRPDGKLR